MSMGAAATDNDNNPRRPALSRGALQPNSISAEVDKRRIKKMSRAAILDQQEFRRPPAARFRRCVGGGFLASTARLGIMSVALVAWILPANARSPQIQSFHPLFPTRPSTAHARSVSALAAAKPARGLAQRKGKMTPEERKRLAAAMKPRTANGKAPQVKKGAR
jgi:hypothetical protein